ncbi:MAG: hypothetical protein HQK53_05445, partial [Oligoflexia bacterium]|nr:hypothetical protein [Oligoflexia bacterium]
GGMGIQDLVLKQLAGRGSKEIESDLEKRDKINNYRTLQKTTGVRTIGVNNE